MSKQDKYTRSAKGKECTVRVPGVCKPAPDNETTVPAHLNGYGMGGKSSSVHIAYACDKCHAWLDGGYVHDDTGHGFNHDLYHLEAVIRTQQIMIKEGVLKL